MSNRNVMTSHHRKIAHNAVCQNCNWLGRPEDTLPITRLLQRVEPGDIMPYGECPNCGSVAIPAYSMEAQDEAARSLLGVCAKAINAMPNHYLTSVRMTTIALATRIEHYLGREATRYENERCGGGV